MTSMVQLRLWLKEASVTERASTLGLAFLIAALVAWALVPASRKPAADDAAVALAATGDGYVSGGTSGTGVAPEDPNGLAPGGDGTAVDASAAAPARSTTARGATASGRSGGASAGVAESSGSSQPLTATDRGVTADTIKVGFTIINLGGTQELGYATGIRTDASQAIDAYVDYANKRGGVLGRKIQAVKVSPDLINASDQRQKCLELTETNAVFAVMDSIAFLYETATACITAEHKTILINGNPGSAENVRRGFPYHVSVQKDDNRKMKDLAVAAKGAGFFDPAKGFQKLGIFEDACSPTVFDAPKDGLKAHLRAVGVSDWSEFRSDCDVASQQRSGPQAVLQFRQDGVTHVLVASQSAALKSYLNAAKAANYFPKYFAGDYVNLASGQVAKGFEPQGFNGALGVTQTHAGEGAIGKPLPPLAQTCSQILTDHGLPPVQYNGADDLGRDIETLMLCENFLLFLQTATDTGPNLTRASWISQLSNVGEYRAAFSDFARFTPRGKMTGGDTTKLMQWYGNCTCWKELTDFGPAAG